MCCYYLNSKIVVTDITKTTSSGGSFSLDIYSASNVIISCIPLNANALWYAVLSQTTGGGQWCTIKSISDNANIANTSVTVRVAYYKR